MNKNLYQGGYKEGMMQEKGVANPLVFGEIIGSRKEELPNCALLQVSSLTNLKFCDLILDSMNSRNECFMTIFLRQLMRRLLTIPLSDKDTQDIWALHHINNHIHCLKRLPCCMQVSSWRKSILIKSVFCLEDIVGLEFPNKIKSFPLEVG